MLSVKTRVFNSGWQFISEKGYTTFRKGTQKGYQINTSIFKTEL